ncbi:DUF4430 domain-containing protein, partial [Acetobacterium bakii]
MKKFLQSFILILVMILELLPPISLVSAAAPSSEWNPSGGSYVISTIADLNAFRSVIAGGDNLGGKTITLANDISIGSEILTPIKTETNNPKFDGVLDGQGHKITGFNDASGGLVYTIENWDGKNGIKNLELNVSIPDNSIAQDKDYYAVAENLGAKIENCKVSGSIIRTNAGVDTVTSGFVNYLNSSNCLISNCISTIDINAGNGTACGIAAEVNSGTFNYCLSLGTLTGTTIVPISGANSAANSYYNADGIKGTLSASSKGIGKTSSELKLAAAFESWDSNFTWKLSDGSYPDLKVFSDVSQADIDLFNQTIANGEIEVAKATYYTPASITAIQTALTAAKIVDTKTASMIALQNAGKNLQTTIVNAIVIPDKTNLQNIITEAGTYIGNSANYTAYSINKLTRTVTSGTSTMTNAEASQATLDSAVANIRTKIDALVSIVDLNTALTNSDTYKNADYTTESFAMLTTAVTAAEIVQTSAAGSSNNITSDQVTTAVQGINDAITGLVTVIQSADKSLLQKAVSDADAAGYLEADYTAFAWGLYSTYLSDAKTILEKADATQTEVDAATKNLTKTVAVTMPGGKQANKTALKEQLDRANALVESNYTAESIAAMAAVKTTAQGYYDNKNLTKQQQNIVDAKTSELKAVIDALTLVERTNTWNPTNGSYVISTAADLDAFRVDLAGGNDFGGKTITLANDIVIGEYKLTAFSLYSTTFYGNFDGEGHKIIGFNDPVYGLFNYMSGSVKNLELNVAISDGAIAAANDYYALACTCGNIENCKVSGSIVRTNAAEGTTTAGFGYCMSTSAKIMSNCMSTIDITAPNGIVVGIFTQKNTNKMIDCLSTGTLTGKTVLPLAGSKKSVDCFYNIEGIKGDLSTLTTGIGKPANDLKQIATFANWDVNYTWVLNEGSYPELKVLGSLSEADKTLFSQTIASGEIEVKKTTYYTPASITVIQTALDTAKAVDLSKVTLSSLLDTGRSLQATIKNAIVIPDKTALQNIITKAGIYTGDSSNYTAYSLGQLNNYVGLAKEYALDKVEVSQTSVDSWIVSVQEKIDALVSIGDLSTALTNSDTYKAADYNTESFAILTTAVTAGEKLQNSAADSSNNISSEEISAAVQGINDAITGLVKVNQGVDKSALQKVVTDAEAAGYVEANYSSDAWKTYSDCLSVAKTVLAKTDATQTEVDTAKINLSNAITTTLVNGALTADKTAMKVQLDRAGSLIESNYTQESYAVVTTTKAAAQTCYENSNLTKNDQNEVDTKTSDLKSAIDALVKVNVNTPPTLSKNEAGQYTISSVSDLNALRSDIQSGYSYAGETVILTGNIDATGLAAYQTPLTQYYIFDGTFDGRGYTISNYTDNQSGLFSVIGSNGIVGDFIVQVNLTYDGTTGIDYKAYNSYNSTNQTGIVADFNGGKVTRCGVTGSIAFTAPCSAGALVGEQHVNLIKEVAGETVSLKGVIKNCYSRVTVTSNAKTDVKYFGLSNDGTVEDSYYAGVWSGSISADSQPLGGGTITNCFYDSNILGKTLNDVKGTANTTRMMKKDTTYIAVGWDFIQSWTVDSAANDGYPKLDFTKKDTLNKRQVISLNFVLEPRTYDASDFETCRMTKLKDVQIVNDLGTNPNHLKVNYSVKDDPFYVGTMGDNARGYVTFNSLSISYDPNSEVDYELDPGVLTGGQRNVARGQFLEDSTADPTPAQQQQIIADSKAACNLIIKKWLGENPDPTKTYDPWVVMAAARNDYSVPDGFYDEYFKTLTKKYADLKAQGVEGKTFDACDTAKDVLLIEAIGYDPRDVGGYDLIDILSRKDTATNGKYFAGQYATFAITAQDFTLTQDSEHMDVNAYIHNLAQIKTTDVQGNTIQNDTASDMSVMGIQPIMAYYNPNAQPGDEWYDVKIAVEFYLNMFENAQSYKGTFWGGYGGAEYLGSKDFDISNYWTNAQVNISLGMAGISPFDSRFVKNGSSPLSALLTSFDLEKGTYDSSIDSYDPTQITRGINALVRSAEGKNQFFNMRDAANSTVVVNNAITALPETITADNKAAVQSATDLYDALNTSKKATISTANFAKLTAAKIAAGITQTGEAAKVVMAQITALPEAAAITLDNQKAVADVRSAYNALSAEDQKLVTNYTKLTDCEAKIADLQKPTDTDSIAAQSVTNQINTLGTITSYDQKAAVEAARSAYNALTKSQRTLVSADTVAILTQAEAAIEKLKPATGSITIDVERFTIGQGFYVEPVTLPIKEGETARQAIEELLGADNLVGDVGYLRAVKGADTGTAAIPDYIVSQLKGGDSAAANAYASRYGGNVLGEFDYSKYSGWYYLVNNQAPNVGMDAYTLKNGDVMRLAFTYWGTGSDLTGIEYGTNKVLVSIANKDSLIKAIAAVNGNSAYLQDTTIKTAYDTAMAAIQDMTASTKATNAATTALNKAVADYKPVDPGEADNAAAKVVTDQINALPGADKLALTDKVAVAAARTAYDGLTETQKSLVTNLGTLTAAEAKIAELEKATPPAKDEATGIEMVGLPAGIGLKVETETDDAEKIDEAEKAAAAAGIKDAKVISLYSIKPDMSEADLAAFNDDPDSFVTLTIPLGDDQQGYTDYRIYHKKTDGTVE